MTLTARATVFQGASSSHISPISRRTLSHPGKGRLTYGPANIQISGTGALSAAATLWAPASRNAAESIRRSFLVGDVNLGNALIIYPRIKKRCSMVQPSKSVVDCITCPFPDSFRPANVE